MGAFTGFLTGLGIGAISTYFLDPDDGHARRAKLRDKTRSLMNDGRDFIDEATHDLRNRASGMVAKVKSRARLTKHTSDDVLEARVRSELGRVVSHPRAIEVLCDDGRVMLSGPILRAEVDELIAAVQAIPGVAEIDNMLEIHDQPGNIPALQGRSSRPGRPTEVNQEQWTPALRLIAGVTGGIAGLSGATRGGITGLALGAVGAGLVARAVANQPVSRLIGATAGRHVVNVQKTITVHAPIQDVFAFWSRFDNFPRFMEHVKQVERRDEWRSHWIVAGPVDTPIEFDAEVTRIIPGRLLAWKTPADAPVKHSGIVQFAEVADGTRIDVRLSYTPPAGILGHAVASLFGVDPEKALDDDMLRFKALLEQGKATAHGEETRRDEVGPQGQPLH
ncbi:MAG TPA: SRPBCC family protein [Polyangia bacterium]|jgi:uncharacterized membrane protein/gas vesicle protein